MNADALIIRPLETQAELCACEDLQAAVWGLDDREIVPNHVLLIVQRHGGLSLGAFEPGGRLVGALFGFLGFDYAAPDHPLMHVSHVMGVLPEWQGRGVGYRLKLAQRERVQAQGLNLVTWTYDPLESPNAALNLGKLGAMCRRYLRDLYGPMRDAMNAGLASDRFEVEWWLDAPGVDARLEGVHCPPDPGAPAERGAHTARFANRVTWRADDLPVPGDAPVAWNGAPAWVEIPAHFQALRKADIALAGAWREHTRALFEGGFAAGYAAVDFVSRMMDGRRRSFYYLQAAQP